MNDLPRLRRQVRVGFSSVRNERRRGYPRPKIDAVPIAINDAVQVGPSAVNLYVSLIDPRGLTGLACVAIPALLELRNIPLHLAHDRRMGHCQPAERVHFNCRFSDKLIWDKSKYGVPHVLKR